MKTKLTFWEVLMVIAFWFSGLAAYLLGGRVWLGYVLIAFCYAVFAWASKQLFLEYRESLIHHLKQNVKNYKRSQAFAEWDNRRQNSHLKGME